jgi:hypothetical protein
MRDLNRTVYFLLVAVEVAELPLPMALFAELQIRAVLLLLAEGFEHRPGRQLQLRLIMVPLRQTNMLAK